MTNLSLYIYTYIYIDNRHIYPTYKRGERQRWENRQKQIYQQIIYVVVINHYEKHY